MPGGYTRGRRNINMFDIGAIPTCQLDDVVTGYGKRKGVA
jgi:hypothetical protein